MVANTKLVETKEQKVYEREHELTSDKNKNQNKKKHDGSTVRPSANAVQQLIEQTRNFAPGTIEAFKQEMLIQADTHLQNTPNIMAEEEQVYVTLESDPNFLQANRTKKSQLVTMLKDNCSFGVLTDPKSHTPSALETYIPKYDFKIAADGREYLSYSVKSFENAIFKDIQPKTLDYLSGNPDTNRFDTSELSHILITEAVLSKASIGNAILAVSMQFNLQVTQNRYLPICVYNHQTGERLNISRQNLEFLYMLWDLRHVLSDEQLNTSFYNMVEDSSEGNNLYHALLEPSHLSFMAHLIFTADNLRKAIRLQRWDLTELLLQDNGLSPENLMELEPVVLEQLYESAALKRVDTTVKSSIEQSLDKKLAIMDLAIIEGKLQTSLSIHADLKPIYDTLIKENTIDSRKTAEALLIANPAQNPAIKIARQEGLKVMAESAIAVERFKKAIEDLDNQPKKDFSLVEEIVSTTSIEMLMQAIPGHVAELRDEAFKLKKWHILSLLDKKTDRFGEWRYRSDSEFSKIVDRKIFMSKPVDCPAIYKHTDEKGKYGKIILGQNIDKCYKFPIELAADAKDWDAVKKIAAHKSYFTHPEHDAGFGAALLAAARIGENHDGINCDDVEDLLGEKNVKGNPLQVAACNRLWSKVDQLAKRNPSNPEDAVFHASSSSSSSFGMSLGVSQPLASAPELSILPSAPGESGFSVTMFGSAKASVAAASTNTVNNHENLETAEEPEPLDISTTIHAGARSRLGF